VDDNHTFQRATSVKKERGEDDHIEKGVIRVRAGRIRGWRGKGVGSFQKGWK